MGVVAATATAVALTSAFGASASSSSKNGSSTDLYIVQVAGNPISAYTGGEAGIAATKPAKGHKVDVTSSAARQYEALLKTKHEAAKTGAGLGSRATVYDYSVVFNGFTIKMNAVEAERMKHTPGVMNVWRNEIHTVETISTPGFLGLSGSGGVWNSQFGDPTHAGEGMIIGDIDSGFWPESPSFAALPNPRPDAAAIAAKFHGTCDAGSEADAARNVTCNNKVIGARWYDAGGLSAANPNEFHSPRDFNSHGSHTASTAGGNYNVNAVVNGVTVGQASGMAPAARISVYKALWDQGDATASGTTADLAAAIDDAVADGVDVINYSISGSQTLVIDPVEIGFMFAADAGVFVSTSAGNSGPTASTVAHNSPWLTTVAASTHDRSFTKTVTLGNGSTFVGPGVGPAVPSSPLVYSGDVGLSGVNLTLVKQCLSDVDSTTAGIQPALDPTKVAGKIVLCDRGNNARVDKSLAVKNAGGVGMILGNVTPNSLNADFHFVPSIHVSDTARTSILAYIGSAGAGATASLSAGVQVQVEAPAMAAFSSTGPARAGGGDLLKPDITAPGVDVIAAVSPAGDNGNLYDAESGTSMSSPHIAGIATLVMAKHPDWSPMMVKSALMTGASQVDNAGNPIAGPTGGNATPLNMGAGHVTPAKAFNPGLVYDSGLVEWVRYGCGVGQFQLVFGTGVCTSFGSIDPSNLNVASLAVGDLAGSQTLTRTVTNVNSRASTYNVEVNAPAGFTVSVSPTSFTIAPGASKTFSVTITRTTAPLGTYQFGSITWFDKNKDTGKRDHVVRSPIAVRPVALAAPAEVTGSGGSGSTNVSVKPGYSGTLTATPYGMVAADVTTQHLVGVNTNFNTAAPAVGASVMKVTVSVPVGTRLARVGTVGSDYPDGTDLDVFMYLAGTNTLVASSADGDADELITFSTPGNYDVYVVQFATVGVTEQDVHHYAWIVPNSAAGNLTATPASQSVTTAVPASVTVSWTGLTAGNKYLGVVIYGDGTSDIGRTIVSVNA
jgi:hypothetical protein